MNSADTIVSVVIPAYNAERTIAQSVRCAISQRCQRTCPEVVVVDDGSSDRTAEIAAAEGAVVIRQDNAGPAAARNRGFRESHGRFVIFTDSDCLADENWAGRLVEAFEDPQVGAAGGSYAMANDGLIASGIHWEIITRHRRFGRYVRALGSYNMAVRREVMEAVGGFDETYPSASGEDNDLSYRICEAGYKLRWVLDATVKHFHTRRLGKYLKEQFRHGFFRARLYSRHRRKISGDDYTTLKDILEPPLVCMLVASLAVSWLGPMKWISLALAVALAAMQVPMTVRIIMAGRKISLMFHSFVMFVRAFARTGGFLSGIISQVFQPRG